MRCVICTDRFDSCHGIVSTQCGHVFHSKCLLKWIDHSKTCPECRGPVSSKNIMKLYFNDVPNDEFDSAHIENDVSTLKAQLREKNMELEASKKKFKELQLRATKMEKNIELDHQREMELEFELANVKLKLKSLTALEMRVHRLQAENETLLKDLEHYSDVKSIVSACQKDAESILRELQNEVTMEIGKTAASRLATHCSVLKRELKRVIEEKNQLRNELTDTKKRLGLSTSSLLNSEKKVKKLEEQLKRSDERNNSLLLRNKGLIPNSNSTVEELLFPKNNNSTSSCIETTKKNNSTSSEQTAKQDDILKISVEAPTVKKMRMEIVVLDKNVEKMSVPKLSTSSVHPYPLTVARGQNDDGSVVRVGYNGLGGHDRVVLGTEKGKYRMHPKFRSKK
ncbi:e3 ubiquitin-protein ligase TRAIP [Trichonephila clavipes]|nr:e3 ubiquitin-protein ligase TRAIP [Trichonephila clavipes]